MKAKRWLAWILIAAMALVMLPVSAESAPAAGTPVEYPEGSPKAPTNWVAVSTKEDFYNICKNPDKSYYLTNDIVFTEADFDRHGQYYNDGVGWEWPSITFSGTLDGRGYSVIGLRFYNTSSSSYSQTSCLFDNNLGTIENIGLDGFYYALVEDALLAKTNTGTIRNCTIRNCEIENIYKGYDYDDGAAGFAKTNDGVIENCSIVDYSIACTYASWYGIARFNHGTIAHCKNSNDPAAMDSQMGDQPSYLQLSYGAGICGVNSGTIKSCVNVSFMRGDTLSGIAYKNNEGVISECYNRGNFQGGGGGISSYNSGEILDCVNEGAIYCSDGGYVGGIVGQNDGGDIVNTYTSGKVSGTAWNIGAVIGKSEDGTVRNNFYQKQSYGVTGAVGRGSGARYTEPVGVQAGGIGAYYQTVFDKTIWYMSGRDLRLYSLDADQLQAIIIQREPDRTRYCLNNPVDTTGLTVAKVLNFGEVVALEDDYTIAGGVTSYGNNDIAVCYNDKEAHFNAIATIPLSLCKLNVSPAEDYTAYVTVTYNGKKLKKDTDYTVEDAKGVVTVTGVNYYSGIVQQEYQFLQPGDVDGNGQIDSMDALAVLQHEAQIKMLTEAYWQAADVDGNGQIDSMDALAILQKEAGILTAFPIEKQ